MRLLISCDGVLQIPVAFALIWRFGFVWYCGLVVACGSVVFGFWHCASRLWTDLLFSGFGGTQVLVGFDCYISASGFGVCVCDFGILICWFGGCLRCAGLAWVFRVVVFIAFEGWWSA